MGFELVEFGGLKVCGRHQLEQAGFARQLVAADARLSCAVACQSAMRVGTPPAGSSNTNTWGGSSTSFLGRASRYCDNAGLTAL